MNTITNHSTITIITVGLCASLLVTLNACGGAGETQKGQYMTVPDAGETMSSSSTCSGLCVIDAGETMSSSSSSSSLHTIGGEAGLYDAAGLRACQANCPDGLRCECSATGVLLSTTVRCGGKVMGFCEHGDCMPIDTDSGPVYDCYANCYWDHQPVINPEKYSVLTKCIPTCTSNTDSSKTVSFPSQWEEMMCR